MSGSDYPANPPTVDADSDVEILADSASIPLVVFDFDGTLAAQRGSWGLLYRLFGVEDRGNERTAAFWDGELTFQEWCEGNVDDWRESGVTRDNLQRVAQAIKLTDGADALLRKLDEHAIPFGVLSSGVDELVGRLSEYEPTFVQTNEIYYDSDIPAGVNAKVGPSDKGEALLAICERRGVSPGDVVYVGDSHSDTEAFAEAGVAILFDPDDRIDDEDYALVDVVVTDRDLTLVADVLGLRGA
jgi:phosphoserine phosphatase